MKTCSKLMSMVLCICMIAAMFVMPVMAADYTVEMAVSATEVNEGDTFTVTISNKAMTVAGFGFALDYDTTALKLISIVSSDAEYPDDLGINKASGKTTWVDLTTWSTLAEANANSSFAAGLVGATDVAYAAGVVTTLTFEALSAAETTLTLNDKSATEAASLAGVAQTATVTVVGAPHEHAWDDGVVTTPATHTAEGVKTYTCECGETMTEAIAKLADHVWDDGAVTTPATHTAEGVKTYTCECGETKTEAIAKLADHVWDDGVVTTEPTETTTGVKTFTCVCGETKTEEIPVLSHTHAWAEIWSKDETNHWKTCSGCAELKDKAAHTWNEGVVTTPATETTTGVKTYTCTVCDQTKTEEIPMIPVVSDPVIVVAKEATGENELTLSYTLKNNAGFKGYGLYVEYDKEAMTLKELKAGELSAGAFTGNVAEAYANFASATEVTADGVLFTAVFDTTNAKAGDFEFTVSGTMANASYVKEEVEVVAYTYSVTCTEHAWGEWEVTTPATCTEDGVKTRTCSFCGETETAAIPAVGHTWGEWEVTTPATCTEAGVKTRTCAVCGETETAAIPATGHNWGDDNICDDCGTEKSAADISPVGPSKENGEDGVVLPFVDVNANDWFYNDVVYVYVNGLMNGTSATTFAPYGITTRGQIVTILWRLEGQPAANGACPFADVASGSYYEAAITWAAANGIVTGYDATTFGPDDQITREQMAAILYRYAQGKQLASASLVDNLAAFTDADKISAYAVEAMNWAVGQGLINGMGDGTVAPQGQAIRAQAAAILHRFCETLELL